MNTLPTTAEMDRAMRCKDASYDGVFFTCVKTTGIFCRPSCSARKPLARNVEFVGSARDALLAGFRPCKRCRPMDTDGAAPDWVNTLFERVELAPADRLRDADLREMRIDPSRARRYFTQHYGMTFQAYHRARRMGLALTRLRAGDDALRVAFDHGYESNSGFREAFERIFGAPPGRCRTMDCIVTTVLTSPLGPMVAGATAKGVCLLEFADRRALERELADLRKKLNAPTIPGTNEHLAQLDRELRQYFDGTLDAFRVPLVTPGSDFQQLVWSELREIPMGQKTSYAALAERIGRPGAQRAVGLANGANRIAIVIPCHRVVKSDGQLSGYGGGVWRKKHLLDLEQRIVDSRRRRPMPA